MGDNEGLTPFQLGKLVNSVENLTQYFTEHKEEHKKQDVAIDALEKKRIEDIAKAEERRKIRNQRQIKFNLILILGILVIAIINIIVNYYLSKGGG